MCGCRECELELARVRSAYRSEVSELLTWFQEAAETANYRRSLLTDIVQAYRACGGELTEQLREAIEAAASDVADDEEVA